MARPLMQVVAEQQQVINSCLQFINSQQKQIDYLGRLAGVETQMASLRITADVNNPADPVPDPPSQGAPETTQQAMTPAAKDDPRVPGMTPGANAHVPAAATDVPMTPGASLPTSPVNQLLDVSAPISGTEGTTGNTEFGNQAGQDAVTRLETDVRALGIGEEGDQMNPTTAFPWVISPDAGNGVPPADGEMAQGSGARMAASLRLAKARIAARVATGDEFAVAAAIEADPAMTGALIAHELGTLSRVAKASTGAPARPGGLVPRRAAAAPRPVVPSLTQAVSPMQALAALGPSSDEIELSDLF